MLQASENPDLILNAFKGHIRAGMELTVDLSNLIYGASLPDGHCSKIMHQWLFSCSEFCDRILLLLKLPDWIDSHALTNSYVPKERADMGTARSTPT